MSFTTEQQMIIERVIAQIVERETAPLKEQIIALQDKVAKLDKEKAGKKDQIKAARAVGIR